MRGRTFLVTGGAGFIGSHLGEALLARGDRVVALDDLSTGHIDNVATVRQHPDFRFVHGSVLDELVVGELVSTCDVVVHLAAAVGVELVLDEPLRSFTRNVRGSGIVFEAADRWRRPVLLASSSEIYGKNPDCPLAEDAVRLLGPPRVDRWAYSTAKAVDETLAHLYHRERGLATTVVRLFNTAGRRQSPAYGMVIPRLVRQAVAGEALTVFGDGRQSRCFAHVTDVVDCLVRLLDHPGANGEVFNVGSQEEVTIVELARRISAKTGGRSPIEMIPYEKAYAKGFEDMCRRLPDTAKVRGLTGWRPTRVLDEILADVVAEAQEEQVAGLRDGPRR